MCRPRALDHEVALTLWHGGLESPTIGKRLNANPGTVRQMVRRMRERGDYRAVRRYLIDGVKKYPARAS